MELAVSSPDRKVQRNARRRAKRATLPQVLTRDELDGRSNAAKAFDRMVAAIQADLGTRDQLSTIENALIEAFAGAAITLNNLNTRLLLGQDIDFSEHAMAVSAMVRVASRLGLARRAKELEPAPPRVGEYIDHIAKQKEVTT